MEKQFDVALLPVGEYDLDKVEAAIREGVEAVGGFDFVKPGMRIGLKANLVASATPDEAVTTHPVVLSAITKILTGMGAQVVIGDSPGGLYTKAYVEGIYRAAGLHECEKYGAKLNDDFSEREADYPEAKSAKKFVYTGYLADCDAIIDVCKLKTHGMMGLSCAAKNLFGTIPGVTKPQYHFRFPSYEAFADMIVDLDEFFHPALSICDAVVGMEGNGPTQGKPRKIGCILVSRSPHKLDLVAAKLIGLETENIPTLMAAHRRGLCPDKAEELLIYGDYLPLCISDYDNVAVRQSLLFGGASDSVLTGIFERVFKSVMSAKPTLHKKDCIGCNKCGRICPASAITIVKGKATIDRKKCIRCFCCQEFCPKGAMKVYRPPVARLIDYLNRKKTRK